jgi:hypothetical protein
MTKELERQAKETWLKLNTYLQYGISEGGNPYMPLYTQNGTLIGTGYVGVEYSEFNTSIVLHPASINRSVWVNHDLDSDHYSACQVKAEEVYLRYVKKEGGKLGGQKGYIYIKVSFLKKSVDNQKRKN